MFDHVVGDTAKTSEEQPRDMKDNPFDENGYYIDRAMKQKDPPILRIEEDAHRIYAQKMEGVHKQQEEANTMETTVLHAEDRGDDPYLPPVNTDREDAMFGEFFYPTPFTDKENLDESVPITYEVSWAERRITEKRFEQLRPYFLFTDKRVIEHTLSNTTQYGRNLLATHSIKENLKSRFPAKNVHRRHEPVATDTVFANVPAIYSGGCKMAQGFVTLQIDGYRAPILRDVHRSFLKLMFKQLVLL